VVNLGLVDSVRREVLASSW